MNKLDPKQSQMATDAASAVRETLEQLRNADVHLLPLSALQTRPCFQPRDNRLVPCRDKSNVERSSSDHKDMLRLILERSQEYQLEPVLVADLLETPAADRPSGWHLVDGHHRLCAYNDARRAVIPARVWPMSYLDAVLVSKLANCTDRALPLHGEQRLEAAWQYLAAITDRGKNSLPTRESLRNIGAYFGVGKSSVARMLSYLPKMDVHEFSTVTRDPGTDWPRWRYVRQPVNPWQSPLANSPEALELEAEKLARTIVELMGNSTPAARARALEILSEEEAAPVGPIGVTDFLAQMARPYGTHVEHVLSQWDTGPLSLSSLPMGTAIQLDGTADQNL